MEATKTHRKNSLTNYEAMLKPNQRTDSFMRLSGLISKKVAEKMLALSKKSRTEWR